MEELLLRMSKPSMVRGRVREHGVRKLSAVGSASHPPLNTVIEPSY